MRDDTIGACVAYAFGRPTRAAHMLFINKLVWAASNGDEEEVARLLEAGQSPDDLGVLTLGSSPMHEASRRGHVACVRLLCRARADVMKRDAVTNETPLHCAVVFGHVEVAAVLVSAGSDLNAQDIAGGTPLQHATTSLFITSMEARQRLIKLLMSAGADPKIRDKVGLSPCDNPCVVKIQKTLQHKEWDKERHNDMKTFLLDTVPAHAAGPYAAAHGAGHGKLIELGGGGVDSRLSTHQRPDTVAEAGAATHDAAEASDGALGKSTPGCPPQPLSTVVASLGQKVHADSHSAAKMSEAARTSVNLSPPGHTDACIDGQTGAFDRDVRKKDSERTVDGLALWLHQANKIQDKIFGGVPPNQVSEPPVLPPRGRELRPFFTSWPTVASAHGGAGAVGAAGAGVQCDKQSAGVGCGRDGSQGIPATSQTAPGSTSLAHASAPARAQQDTADEQSDTLDEPEHSLGMLGKPSSNKTLVTFIGSTQTVSISDKHTAAKAWVPSAPKETTPPPPPQKKDVESLINFAAGLFTTPPFVHQGLASPDHGQTTPPLPQRQASSPHSLSPPQQGMVQMWEEKVIASWTGLGAVWSDGDLLAAWRQGLPPRVRGRVWLLAIGEFALCASDGLCLCVKKRNLTRLMCALAGNDLQLSRSDYEHCLAMTNLVVSSGLDSSGPDPRKPRASSSGHCARVEHVRSSAAADEEPQACSQQANQAHHRKFAGSVPDEVNRVSMLEEEPQRTSPRHATQSVHELDAGEGAMLCKNLKRIECAGQVMEPGSDADPTAVSNKATRFTGEPQPLAPAAESEAGQLFELGKSIGIVAAQAYYGPDVAFTGTLMSSDGERGQRCREIEHGREVRAMSNGSLRDSQDTWNGGGWVGEVGVEVAWIDQTTIRQINLDLDRTYTDLGLFGADGPYQSALRDVLFAYCCFRPSVGYVQGMGYLASTLLLYMDPPAAFVCMGNLLHKHHFPAFLRVDMAQIDHYAAAFTHVFASHLPALHRHLSDTGVDCRLYLVEWWMTVFCTVLPLSASSLVWDLLLLEGISAIVRITIGILAVLEQDLLGASLEKCLTVLTHAEDWFENTHDGTAASDLEPVSELQVGQGNEGLQRESKSFAAVLEAAESVQVTSEAFMTFVSQSQRGLLKVQRLPDNTDHLQQMQRILQTLARRTAELAKKDELAARERRGRIHDFFTRLIPLTDETEGSRLPSADAQSPARDKEGEEGMASEPLLAASMEWIPEKFKDDVRGLPLFQKAEELLMPLTARATSTSAPPQFGNSAAPDKPRGSKTGPAGLEAGAIRKVSGAQTMVKNAPTIVSQSHLADAILADAIGADVAVDPQAPLTPAPTRHVALWTDGVGSASAVDSTEPKPKETDTVQTPSTPWT